ncbi:MAG TPA: ABC transporter ATP-binding protein [Microscillaceae bacterium]|nr:ABC transporter ATP-binding protein [Microscillaceae bacterium]
MFVEPNDTSELILEVKNLEVTFNTDRGSRRVVNHINFNIRRGEVLGIVGESGSGKSITSLAIMRLIQEPPGKITDGEILFHAKDGRVIDLLQLSKEEMRDIRGGDIAMIFQEPMSSLNPVFTCGNQVIEAIKLHQQVSYAEAKEIALAMFEEVQFQDPKRIFNSYPHQISGGQKQRVMIAMALCCEPSLLIADEPTTALDVTVQKEILALLEEIRLRHNTSMIFITHDLGVIAEIAHRVMVMYKGNIMEKGDTLDIFSNPRHPYTKGLLACRTRMDIKIRDLATISDYMEETDEGDIVEKVEHKSEGLGNIILNHFIPEDEIEERNKTLASHPPMLEVKNLKKYFKVTKGEIFKTTVDIKKAVEDVSFFVYPGETVGLVGESGCGKTTLGRLILRLLEPDSGEIWFNGKDISHVKGNELRNLRSQMQIIFQDPYSSLNPRLTVGETLTEPMMLHNIESNAKLRKEKAMHLLERVGLLPEHYSRYPHEFSGGQRQRICIARALAVEPNFIIADESVSALDVSVQAQVLNLLQDLRDEFQLTYIFISHDLSVVKHMSDRIIVMRDGQIQELGYAEDIYEKPTSPYTKKLIDSIPLGTSEEIYRVMRRRGIKY